MFIKKLSLQNFRNYKDKVFNFRKAVTVLVGPNAVGKTSVIEALNLLATGNSIRAEKIEEMVAFDQELARVKGKVVKESEISLADYKQAFGLGDFEEMKKSGRSFEEAKKNSDSQKEDEVLLEVLLTKGMVQGKRTQRRLFSVNDVRRRKVKFVGNLLTVVFRPEDMRLVEGSKGRRRGFMDSPLSLIDAEYARSLKTYQQTLIRRNKMLNQIREGEVPKSALTFWTMSLIKHGEVVQKKRREFLDFFKTIEFPIDFTVEYDASIISDTRMKKYASRELAAGHTLIGPHKDDLIVKLDERAISKYGSRGQQRMAVLWLKLGELEFLKDRTQSQPVLLLDDILSELDENNQRLVLSLLKKGQSIVTTADEELVPMIKRLVGELEVMKL